MDSRKGSATASSASLESGQTFYRVKLREGNNFAIW